MQIYTAHTLWKEYDRSALPLGTGVLKTEKKPGFKVSYVYFNGEAALDGCTRIYAELYTPDKPNGASLVLMNEPGDEFSLKYVKPLFDKGYSVLIPDYLGKREGHLFTIYPQSLSAGNFFADPGVTSRMPENAKLSCWYIWATVMARGVTFLENQPSLDRQKISIVGVRLGAFQVWKASLAAKGVRCAAALFNSGYIENLDTASDEVMAYNASLDNSAYAALNTLPILAEIASNDSSDALSYMNGLFSSASGECRFSISERSDGIIGFKQRQNLELFIDNYTLGIGTIPKTPSLNARNSEKMLYYEVKVDRPKEIAEVELFIACGGKSAYRNWSKIALTAVSEDEYFARVNVYLPKENIYAFINVKYKNGLSLSSEIVEKNPYLMGVTQSEIVRSRLIYTADKGVDDWLIRGSSKCGSVSVAKGPHGIDGITSDCGGLTTFKIGDVRYKGERDYVLQLLVWSALSQTLVFTVTENAGGTYITHTALKDIQASSEWTKINISYSDFRSLGGGLSGWDKAVSLNIESKSELLINSLLWI